MSLHEKSQSLGLEFMKLEEKEDFQKEKDVPQEENTSEDSLQKEINQAYEDWCDYEEADYKCTAILNPEPLQGKDLLEVANTLLKKPASTWTREDVIPIANLLAGRTCVDARGDNYEGATAYSTLLSDLDEFVLKHSDIRGMIDPVYVVADIGEQVPDFGLADYPPVGSPHPPLTPFMNSNYIWVFTGDNEMDRALHLIGWLQCRINGLRLFVFKTTTPAMYY